MLARWSHFIIPCSRINNPPTPQFTRGKATEFCSLGKIKIYIANHIKETFHFIVCPRLVLAASCVGGKICQSVEYQKRQKRKFKGIFRIKCNAA
jgi:hypothetical protein